MSRSPAPELWRWTHSDSLIVFGLSRTIRRRGAALAVAGLLACSNAPRAASTSQSATAPPAVDSARAAALALAAAARDPLTGAGTRLRVARVRRDSAGYLVLLVPVVDTAGGPGYRVGSGGGDATVRVGLDGRAAVVERGQ